MTLDPAIFRALVAQGATPEMLLAVVEADAAVQEERRAAKRANNAERQQRFRDKGKRNGSNALQGVTPRDACDAPPNDIYSNPPVPPSAKADEPPLADRVVSAWNDGPKAKGATGATALDANRRKWLALRVRDHGEQAVFAAIANLAASPFHCGANDRGWRANIGWLLKSPENFLKALEMGGATTASPKPADPEAFRAFCTQSAENCRRMGREQEALDWEAKARGEDRRRASTGPPRAVGEIADLLAQSHRYTKPDLQVARA